MKDAHQGNSGHFNVEIKIPALEAILKKPVRPYVDAYELPDGRGSISLVKGV